MSAGSSADDLRDALAGDIRGDTKKKVWVHITRPQGQEDLWLLLYVEENSYDEDRGCTEENKEVKKTVGGGNAVVSPKALAGICAICDAPVERDSFTHCSSCNAGIGKPCSIEDPREDDDYYCPECWRHLRRDRWLRAIGRLLISPFIEWESDE